MSNNIFKAVAPFLMGVSLTSATYGYVDTKHFLVFAMIVILNAVGLWVYIYAVKTEPDMYSRQFVLDYAAGQVTEALLSLNEPTNWISKNWITMSIVWKMKWGMPSE